MEVIDAQVHLNQLGSTEAGLAAMQAAGVDACLIDEWEGDTPEGKWRPGVELPNGAVRTLRTLVAEDYARRWPGKFAYYGRTEALDPDLEDVMAEVLSQPGARCLRVFVPDRESALFESGGYERLFKAADRHRVPCFVWLNGKTHLLKRYVEQFPDLPFVFDHCGNGPASWPGPEVRGDARFAGLARTYDLARYPNVSLKWSQSVRMSAERFPFNDLIPALLRTLEHFSVERVFWGSDYTQLRQLKRPFNWAEIHLYIQATSALSEGDKEAILGRSLRKLLKWPA